MWVSWSVPTLNEYTNKYGYYINAWTSTTGNITYKIRDEGYTIIDDLDISDDDDISWDIIRSLKSLSLIYTDQSGTIPSDEFNPDPQTVAATELSKTAAEELLDTILEHQELTATELEEICEILGIESESVGFERLESQLNEKLRDLIETGELPTKQSLETTEENDVHVVVTTKDLRSKIGNDVVGTNIKFISRLERDDTILIVDHYVFVSDLHGIESWGVRLTRNHSWDIKGEVTRQKGILLPVVAELLEDAGIDAGDSSDTLAPRLYDFEDETK